MNEKLIHNICITTCCKYSDLKIYIHNDGTPQWSLSKANVSEKQLMHTHAGDEYT